MKRFLKNTIAIALLGLFGAVNAQVLITKDKTADTPDPSAILEIRDTEAGFLFPKANFNGVFNDNQNPVQNPVYGLTLLDTGTDRLYFWDTEIPPGMWIRNFRVSDAEAILQKTINYSSNSTQGVLINTGWSNSPDSFAENSGTNGWTSLGVNVTISPTKAANDVFISAEGMAQLNNTSQDNYSFAIGLFVDGQLKVVRKFYVAENSACTWKKFEVNGLFENMAPGNHTVQLYGRNLRKSSGSGNLGLYYGTKAPGTACTNMNENMARIFLTAQLTE